MPPAPLTVVCLASYFKGGDFLRECHDRSCHVALVAREKLRDEPWPWNAIDEFVTVRDESRAEDFIDAACALGRRRTIDRVVALEEYDVLHAAAVREHLRMPGMTITAARRFRDKLAMRIDARAAGVTVPDFAHALNRETLAAFMARVPPPWVLKPRSDVSAVGIQKLDDPRAVRHAVDALDARPVLTERSSYYLLEQFLDGDVYHVDALVEGGQVIFAGAHRYQRPPMEVAHHGGVFVTSTVARGSPEERSLLEANRAVLSALALERGATHAEFILGTDGRLSFLEVAARVGGALIAEVLEAATGINLWRAWAALEIRGRDEPAALEPTRADYAGIALALARQEWPDTSAYTDPEIVHRLVKRHHVGLIVRSARLERVSELLDEYATRFGQDFLAVLPPLEKPD